MRRADREVTDEAEILSWLREAPVGRLGFADGGEPYVVPLNFGILATAPLSLVFHSADTGRKLEMMARNPRVCFEADLPGELVEGGATACRWGMSFRSVMAWGRLERIQDTPEKKAALEALMAKYSSRNDWVFDPAQFNSVVLLKLTVEQITAKQKR